MKHVALEGHMQLLAPYLNREAATEICINKPGEIFVESDGLFTRYELSDLNYEFLYSLASLVAEANHQSFPSPFVSGRLPSGERAQFVLPPACEAGKVVCSIRRQRIRSLTLDDYQAQGAFDSVATKESGNNVDAELREHYEKGEIKQLIALAVRSRKNILISGGTGTGKTTFLNSCLKLVPESERIITIEDVREVVTNQPNSAHLIFNESDQGLSATNVFKSCLRLRPDRILLSELRGKEVWPFLRAINSGHPGSMSTVHANSTEAALDQLIFMAQQSCSEINPGQLSCYIQSGIHLIIQLERVLNSRKNICVRGVYLTGI